MPTARLTDNDRVLIVGGGIGGSLLAMVLGRQGVPVTVFDPKRVPAPSFRNEKVGEEQADILKSLGALEPFARVCLPLEGDAKAYAVNPRLTDCGAHHHDWVAAVRADWPDCVTFVEATVSEITTSDVGQFVVTSDGARHEGRLVVLTSGRAAGLHKALGIDVKTVSAGHSVTLGFTLQGERHIPATVFAARPQSHIGYVSVFPIASPAGAKETRVNIFSFKPLTDDWTRRMSRDPLATLAEVAPEAVTAMAGLSLTGRCELRGTDLYRVRRHQRPGLVLLGDAFHAPCPSSGTGLLRVLSDARAQRPDPAMAGDARHGTNQDCAILPRPRQTLDRPDGVAAFAQQPQERADEPLGATVLEPAARPASASRHGRRVETDAAGAPSARSGANPTADSPTADSPTADSPTADSLTAPASFCKTPVMRWRRRVIQNRFEGKNGRSS
jgi:2-polyprenyl-6-methoxyphenol hydroxylase-like FAD-dependent oxidoreductase